MVKLHKTRAAASISSRKLMIWRQSPTVLAPWLGARPQHLSVVKPGLADSKTMIQQCLQKHWAINAKGFKYVQIHHITLLFQIVSSIEEHTQGSCKKPLVQNVGPAQKARLWNRLIIQPQTSGHDFPPEYWAVLRFETTNRNYHYFNHH